ncbi:UPF0565 protein C2orf69 homolog [Xiphophorus maculatus]|uniref:Chromosome 2 open reading frame 69 n=1 Tax=Xiphophorus maculatus TaxID=8083 RepID=M3ZY59_XIPMA|nr:UPF0565 protein C2orf69 homolog [Xiphophorus maculatus]XP_032423186.1 UPF0565 protein C2orf69 homolog [Xiphophorus hellerii]
MLSSRALAAVAAGITLITVAEHMSSVAGTAHCGLRGPQGSGSPNGRRLQRLVGVSGCGPNRVNDLLLLRPESDEESCSGTKERGSNRHVVFFHGDIQNFKEEMAVQPEASQWLSWSLEQVALVLGQRFPNRNIWVVKASRMYLNKFSCYQNFVESNMFGAPEHTAYTADGGAFHQLRSLLTNAMERAKLPPSGGAGGLPPGFSLTLVGFSKGCVVLNQLVYELPGARADPNMAAFVRRISDVFWLDGGHPGGSRTWVTDREALRELAASGVSVHAHVTPYEVRDPMRAWVGREYGVFIQTLEELGACPSRKLHFQDEPPSIQNHFRVILEF